MKIFVANWKMQLPLKDEMAYCHDNLNELKKIKNKIILCPSFPALIGFAQLLDKSDVALGAQTCSEFASGPYTGQISANNLAQAGCSYVIVGHSEERSAFKLSNEQVAQKALRVLEAGMIPIVCIGETKEEHKAERTQDVLLDQLDPIIKALDGSPAYIAYEPLWAIGSGETPDIEELKALYSWLKTVVKGCAFFYGGSVDEKSIEQLKTIDAIAGFLVGGASLDFQQLKKVVS
jgi:triosephosphate isomerase